MVVRLVQTVVWFVACCGLVVFISLRFSGRPQIGVLVMDFALYVVSDVVSGGFIYRDTERDFDVSCLLPREGHPFFISHRHLRSVCVPF